MTHSRQWNGNSPLDSEQVKHGPLAIRNLKEDFSERFGVDHIIGESIDDGAGQDGHHKQLTMKDVSSELLQSGSGFVTVHVDDSHIYCIDYEGREILLTPSEFLIRQAILQKIETKSVWSYRHTPYLSGLYSPICVRMANSVKTGFNLIPETDNYYIDASLCPESIDNSISVISKKRENNGLYTTSVTTYSANVFGIPFTCTSHVTVINFKAYRGGDYLSIKMVLAKNNSIQDIFNNNINDVLLEKIIFSKYMGSGIYSDLPNSLNPSLKWYGQLQKDDDIQLLFVLSDSIADNVTYLNIAANMSIARFT